MLKEVKKMATKTIVNISELPKRISQPYVLTQKFEFNLHEQRIIARVLQYIKNFQYVVKDDSVINEKDIEITFKPKDLTSSNDFSATYNALRTLRKKEIVFENKVMIDGQEENVKTITGFFKEVDYSDKKSFVTVKLNRQWFQILTDLSRGFTSFLASFAYTTSNLQHYIIYQYVCHWYKKGKLHGIEMNEAQVRKNFNIDESKYRGLGEIIKKIIDPCKAELDKHSDLSFNYTAHKLTPGAIRGKGAKVIGITFKFYKTNNIDEKINSTYDAKKAAVMIKEFVNRYNLNLVQEAQLGGIFKKFDIAFISVTESEARSHIKNSKDPIDYFYKILNVRASNGNNNSNKLL